MRFLLAALLAATLSAQEIRGTVHDPTINQGISAATVTLSNFSRINDTEQKIPIATATTDSQGAFLFTGVPSGVYQVDVHKDSYKDPAYAGDLGPADSIQSANLNPGHPNADLRFSMIRTGAITGRVVDEDGNPIADLAIGVHGKFPPAFLPERVVTGRDGTFSIPEVSAGSYFLQTLPKLSESFQVSAFSPGDLNVVDRDFESSFGPAITVSPGGQASAGVIQLRKVPYYRIHVSLRDDCTSGPDWSLTSADSVADDAPVYFPCRKEFLISGVQPGSYVFAFSNQQPGPAARWALIPVQVTSKNLEIPLAMSPPSDLRGRIVAAAGATLPPFARLMLALEPALQGLSDYTKPGSVSIDPEGNFSYRNLLWSSVRIRLDGLGPNYYVKEIRTAGVASPDRTIPLIPGASPPIEIVVDDHAASLTGSVTDGDQPVSGAFILWSGFQDSAPPIPSQHRHREPLAIERAVHDAQQTFFSNLFTTFPISSIGQLANHPLYSGRE